MGAESARAKAGIFARVAAAGHAWSSLEFQGAWFVPGRVELLGKHTDYGGGRSLLCTVERGFCVLAAARADREVRLLDVRTGERTAFVTDAPPPSNWARYCAAVAHRLAVDGRGYGGADIAFASDLPAASGMSSSSAFVVASYLAMLDGRAGPSGEELAAYLAATEAGVGTHGGSEDHTAILCCRPGRWSPYHFQPLQAEATVAAPDDFTLVIAVSGVVASKAGKQRSAYNRCAAAVAEILARWNLFSRRADAALGAALASSPEAYDNLRAELASQPALQGRLEQFWNESEIWIPSAVAAAREGNWRQFGETVARSQAAAEAVLGNQTPELIALVASARKRGAVAASSFGAGFGGSVWALVPRAHSGRFRDAWLTEYQSAFAAHAAASLCFESAAGPPAMTVWRQGAPG